jgi:hypothetical protein
MQPTGVSVIQGIERSMKLTRQEKKRDPYAERDKDMRIP